MNRYAPGGDLFEELSARYGRAAAENVWRASETGDRAAISEAIAQAQNYYTPRNTSTGSIFAQQITTDPLAVPLESANRGIGTILGSAIKGLFKNPWVLLVVVVVVVVYFWPVVGPMLKRLGKRA